MANEDWMAGFTNRTDLNLTDITFPASHDAGLSEAVGGYEGYWVGSSSASVICQYTDIAGQLDAGSRAFDLRIAPKNGVLRTFHGEGLGTLGGGWGQRADTIFQQIDTFLSNHTGEIVIIRISHTKESAGVHNLILNTIDGSRLFKCGPRNLATVPLDKLRGKAIAVFDTDALAKVNPMGGLHRLLKHGGDIQGGLPICGKYAGQSAGLLKMVKTALTYGNEHGTHTRTLGGKHDHLFMVYWQLALDVKTKTTKGQDQRLKTLKKIEESKGTHYNLDYLLNAHLGLNVAYTMDEVNSVGTNVTFGNRLFHRPNYVNLDFVNEISCNKVIEFNVILLL